MQGAKAGQRGGQFVPALIVGHGVDAVGQPINRGRAVQGYPPRGGGGGLAVGRPWLRLQRAQHGPGLRRLQQAAGLDRFAASERRRAQDQNRPLAPLGMFHDGQGGLLAQRPARCGRPAVVNHQYHGPLARQIGAGVQQWMGQGQNRQGRQSEAQQCQPQWRRRRCFFFCPQAKQNANGRKRHPARAGRRDPQQPPDHRQGDQAQQHPGRDKGQGTKGQHQTGPSRPSLRAW